MQRHEKAYHDTGTGGSCRVWKGILGIRDLTKIRCVKRENDKYLDGIRDLTAPREAGLAKIRARDAGFFLLCLLGIREIVTTQINVVAAEAAGVSFQNQTIECAWLILTGSFACIYKF